MAAAMAAAIPAEMAARIRVVLPQLGISDEEGPPRLGVLGRIPRRHRRRRGAIGQRIQGLQGAPGLPPILRAHRHEPVDDRLQGAVHVGLGQADRQAARHLIHHLLVGVDGVVALGDPHRGPTGQEEPQQPAGREEIGGRARVLTQELLGGGVLGGAHEGAHPGEAAQAAVDLGDAEVGHLGVGDDPGLDGGAEEDVARLEVAVDDVGAVGHREGVHHLVHRGGGHRDRERSHPGDVLLEGPAGLVAGDQVGRAAGPVDEAEALDDVRVLESLEDLGLGGQAAQEGPAVALVVEDLDRQLGPDEGVVRVELAASVGHARGPAGEHREDPVGPVQDVAWLEQGGPGLGARGAAAHVGAGRRVLGEGGEAARAVAGHGHGADGSPAGPHGVGRLIRGAPSPPGCAAPPASGPPPSRARARGPPPTGR